MNWLYMIKEDRLAYTGYDGTIGEVHGQLLVDGELKLTGCSGTLRFSVNKRRHTVDTNR